jgi:hypothetical protein
VLVIEVAESSLSYDTGEKLELYAADKRTLGIGEHLPLPENVGTMAVAALFA